VTVRIDTPKEQRYYRHGGILQYVLRQLLTGPYGAEALADADAVVVDPQQLGIALAAL
jgi:hypothetical protein